MLSLRPALWSQYAAQEVRGCNRFSSCIRAGMYNPPSFSSFCLSVLDLVRILVVCMIGSEAHVLIPCFYQILLAKKMMLMWFLHFLLIPQWTRKIKPFNDLNVNPNPYDLSSAENKQKKMLLHKISDALKLVSGRGVGGAGSGKVYEAGFELGTPETLLLPMRLSPPTMHWNIGKWKYSAWNCKKKKKNNNKFQFRPK